MRVLRRKNVQKYKIKLREVCDTSYHKECTKILRRKFNLALRTNANCYCQIVILFFKNAPLSEINVSPTNDNN